MSGSSVIWPLFSPKLPVPLALVYWTDQPFTEAVVVPRLNSSTKSWVWVAPLLPPPPYTWLMTTLVETARARIRAGRRR